MITRTKTILITCLITCGVYCISVNKERIFSEKVSPKQIDIAKVMNYPMPHIVARYCKDYNVSLEDAQEHEVELKRFFILAGKYDDGIDMFSLEVDNLWHTFLLFTKEYQRFCNDMFGKFIHHDPVIEEI